MCRSATGVSVPARSSLIGLVAHYMPVGGAWIGVLLSLTMYRARMVQSVNAETFLAHEGSEFDVRDLGEDVVLRLTKVRSLGHQPRAPRVDPFALEFRGPSLPVLEQRIYRLGHPALGELEIFLVPIGVDPAGGLRYEAVFN